MPMSRPQKQVFRGGKKPAAPAKKKAKAPSDPMKLII